MSTADSGRGPAEPRDDAASVAPDPLCLLTADEVAALIKVSTKTIYKLVEEGKLPGIRRIGRRVRFYRPALIAWLAGQQSASPRRPR